MKTTYTDTVKCPEGHTFKLLRRKTTTGKKVRTYCRQCEHSYQIEAGPIPKDAP